MPKTGLISYHTTTPSRSSHPGSIALKSPSPTALPTPPAPGPRCPSPRFSSPRSEYPGQRRDPGLYHFYRPSFYQYWKAILSLLRRFAGMSLDRLIQDRSCCGNTFISANCSQQRKETRISYHCFNISKSTGWFTFSKAFTILRAP